MFHDGLGRTHGGGSDIQRGWLTPNPQLFGQVTSRARHPRLYEHLDRCLTNTEEPWKCRWVLIPHRRIQLMSAPRKYGPEFRERAVRMYRERLGEAGDGKGGGR